jgi:CRP-like cAMP-binding protein
MPVPTADELRTCALLGDLTDEEAAWIAARCDVRSLDAGDVLFRTGETPDWMYLTLAGAFEARREDHGMGAPAFVWGAGDVTGIIPFSRMTTSPSTARALAASRVACFPRTEFAALLARVPRLEARFVALLADRVREATRRDQQQEKLAALGRMAAGLAHELNNPAAAVQRFAGELARALAGPTRVGGAGRAGVGAPALATLEATRARLRAAIGATHARRTARATAGEDALDRSDREDALVDWLTRRGSPRRGSWRDARRCARHRDDCALAAQLADAVAVAAPGWLAAALTGRADRGIGEASTRITALVTRSRRTRTWTAAARTPTSISARGSRARSRSSPTGCGRAAGARARLRRDSRACAAGRAS